MGFSRFLTDLLPRDTADSRADGGLSDRSGEITNESRADDAADVAVIYECRECGTTVSADASRCPSCGARAIAEYPVE